MLVVSYNLTVIDLCITHHTASVDTDNLLLHEGNKVLITLVTRSITLKPIYTIQPVVKPVWQLAVSCKWGLMCSNTRYSLLSNRLSNEFDKCWTNSCSINRLSNRVVQLVWQPCWTNSHCSFNQLSKRVVQPAWQLAVYTRQPFVKPVVKRVWQPVECLYTWYNRLSSRFDNWLYREFTRLSKPLWQPVWQQAVSCIRTH